VQHRRGQVDQPGAQGVGRLLSVFDLDVDDERVLALGEVAQASVAGLSLLAVIAVSDTSHDTGAPSSEQTTLATFFSLMSIVNVNDAVCEDVTAEGLEVIVIPGGLPDAPAADRSNAATTEMAATTLLVALLPALRLPPCSPLKSTTPHRTSDAETDQ
jgi:hypothetical protein